MQLTITGPEDRLAALLEIISDAAFYFRRVGDQVHIVAQLGTVTAVNDDEFEQTHAEPEPAPEVDTPDDKTPEVEAPTGTLSNNIVRHLKAHGPATTVDIAEACGAESGDTLKMLRRLRELGKVESAGRSGWKVAERKAFDADAARRRAGQGF